jgi:hypothetical protein
MSHSLTITDAARSAFLASLSDPAVAAAVLADLAIQTNNPAYRVAAGLLKGKAGGRPALPDDALLTRMSALISSGTARSAAQAARFVANTIEGRAPASTADRLAKKYLEAKRDN